MQRLSLRLSARLLPFLLVLVFAANTLRGQDVILQGFYWNTHPGDITNTTTGGLWWDTLAAVAPQLAQAGFKTVWTPPANKGFAGVFDMGYGVYDYFDYGQYNQNGTTRTRHGNFPQFQNMMTALHGQGLKVMADVVLNHRAGASETQREECDHNGDNFREPRFTKFRPASNRILMDSMDFHPNNTHCDLFEPYHDRIFFEDICYFNLLDQVLDPMQPNNGWYFGPHNLGKAGDSLIVWGRNLFDPVNGPGFDEIRLDAVKHVEPGFMAPFLVELFDGPQPYAVGELFDGDLGTLANYRNEVEGFVSNFGIGSKDANLAIFDFSLRYALRDLCNNGSGGYNMWNLNNAGLRLGAGLPAEDVVTFVENHDVDRIGYVATDCNDPEVIATVGATCLKFGIDSGHDPVFQDKDDLGYPYIMAAEGRPTVFWKDWFWYNLRSSIEWQMHLRNATAAGTSTPIANLNPSFTAGNGGDLFVLNRNGGGGKPGLVLALNDNPSATASAWVNTPFPNQYLKDYSDGYLFQYTQAFADSRAQVKAQPRDYAWWAPTGLYPTPPGTSSHFQLDATPGGCPHFVVMRVADAPLLRFNQQTPIAVGDEVAIKNATGKVVGIGRVGQGFAWDGVHDMVIEVLGSPSANGMGNGEVMQFVGWDQSTGQEIPIAQATFAFVGNVFSFKPLRPATPNRNGNFSTFNLTATAQGLFTCGGISRVLFFDEAFSAGSADVCGNTSRADAAVYNDGLQSGDDDGTGFQGWTDLIPASNSGFAGFFTGNSTTNGDGDGNGDGDINTGGKAWGFYANTGNIAEATRPFLTPMPDYARLTFRLDNGWLDDPSAAGVVGFSLRNSSNQNLMEFYFREGDSQYTINDATDSSPNNSNIPFTDEGLAVEIYLYGSSAYFLSITPLAGGGPYTFDRTFSNTGSPDRIRFFNFSAGGGDPRNLFVNSLNICSPPTLVINEIDYDQPGGVDAEEFVEIKNVSNNPVDLSAYALQLLDGSGTPYQTVNLTGTLAPGAYHVVCNNGSGVPNCNQFFASSTDQIDDGPAAVRLLFYGEVTTDSVYYEGAGVSPGDNDLIPAISLSRFPDGSDQNDNSDWVPTCKTPGTFNEQNSTDTDNDGAPDACDPCPLAAENSIPGFDAPNCACLPGKFAVYAGNIITGCTDCPPGTFCPDGLNAYPCPVNTSQGASGQIACEACPSGTHAAEGSTSCTPNTPPQIALSGNNTAIPNRSNSSDAGNDTNFGTVAQGTPVTRTFTVENLFGSNPLTLTGVPMVTVAGVHQQDFSATQPIASSLPGGSITTFTVTFTPSAPGLRSALIILTHNDLPENPFVFAVEGAGF